MIKKYVKLDSVINICCNECGLNCPYNQECEEIQYIRSLPTIDFNADDSQEENYCCEFCANHEDGDTLYETSDWDGGIGFDYIRDIHYCPICGQRLK